MLFVGLLIKNSCMDSFVTIIINSTLCLFVDSLAQYLFVALAQYFKLDF